jgi:hypothetical protein
VQTADHPDANNRCSQPIHLIPPEVGTRGRDPA